MPTVKLPSTALVGEEPEASPLCCVRLPRATLPAIAQAAHLSNTTLTALIVHTPATVFYIIFHVQLKADKVTAVLVNLQSYMENLKITCNSSIIQYVKIITKAHTNLTGRSLPRILGCVQCTLGNTCTITVTQVSARTVTCHGTASPIQATWYSTQKIDNKSKLTIEII